MNKLVITSIIFSLFLVGCADRPPKNLNNICDIYKEKRHWYSASLKTEKKWGVPVHIPMAFIHQESKFNGTARPPKKYFLWIIPAGRVSSAYGFAQAQTMTWNDYIKDTGNSRAKRNNFADSIDFIGWYMDKTQKVNGVSKWDARNQYLNYHEGWAGYKRRTHNSKGWLLNVAQKVNTRASNYGAQYNRCKVQLSKPQSIGEWIFGV